MALNYIYSDSTGSTIDITDRCRVNQLSVKDQAEEGAVAISTLVVDDPDGDIDFIGHRRFYIYEDTAPAGDQLIYNGFTFNERITRGPNNVGVGRQWTLDLADVNVFLNRRIMNGADANRPAETDTERIQALLTMTELNTVDDDTFVNTTADTVDMDAADYRGQNVGQYIDDCRQASGKNAYVYYNETLGEYGLWYDFAQSSLYDSACKLSNVLSDIDQDTVFEYTDDDRTSWNRDPTRVASGVYLEFDGVGSPVYAQDPGTTATFAAIDWAAPSVNVKTLAKATARATRYLFDAASEDVKLHVVALMPRAKVNAIKKGQLVEFKGSHFPGFEDYVTCRVLNRTVNEISEDPYLSFEVELDLDPWVVVPESSVMWVNLYGLNVYGIATEVGNITDQSPGFVNPIGLSAVLPGDGIAALFVLPWTAQGIAGTGQTVDPDPPADPVTMIANGGGDFEAGWADMIVDPTSGEYTFTGYAGGGGRIMVSTLACFASPTGSPYSRVQSAIANGTATLSAPATLGNLLCLAIACGAPQGYFPGETYTDTPDIPEQAGWTAVAPRAKLDSPPGDLDEWPAIRLYYKIAAGGETAITIDPGTWPYSTAMVVEYAP